MTSLADWSPYEKYVQSGLPDGAYAHGAFTLLAAGPPRLSDVQSVSGVAFSMFSGGAASNQLAFPIGIIQNYNLAQQKSFARIFELGSERSYFIGGRTVGQIGLGRVYYNGASLLRVLYAYYQELLPPMEIGPMFQNHAAGLITNPHDVIIPPGYENIFINLASDLFNQPVGLLKYIRDSNQRTLGALYVEHVVVPGHSWAVDSQGLLIQEQASLQYERLVPVAIQNVSLVTDQTPYTGGSSTSTAGFGILGNAV